MSNRINCKGLETDMLWDLADHARFDGVSNNFKKGGDSNEIL